MILWLLQTPVGCQRHLLVRTGITHAGNLHRHFLVTQIDRTVLATPTGDVRRHALSTVPFTRQPAYFGLQGVLNCPQSYGNQSLNEGHGCLYFKN